MFRKMLAKVRLFVLKLDESVWGIFIGLAAGIAGSHLNDLANINLLVGITLLLSSGSISLAVFCIVLKKKFQTLVQKQVDVKVSLANSQHEIIRSYLNVDDDEMAIAESNSEVKYATAIAVLTFLLYVAATFCEYQADVQASRVKEQPECSAHKDL